MKRRDLSVKSLVGIIYHSLFPEIILRDYVSAVRRNVNKFLDHCVQELPLGGPVLGVGPQPNSYSTKLFAGKFDYTTLDNDSQSGLKIIADICRMPESSSIKRVRYS